MAMSASRCSIAESQWHVCGTDKQSAVNMAAKMAMSKYICVSEAKYWD